MMTANEIERQIIDIVVQIHQELGCVLPEEH